MRTRLETPRSALRDVTGTASMGAECTPMGRHGRTLHSRSRKTQHSTNLAAPSLSSRVTSTQMYAQAGTRRAPSPTGEERGQRFGHATQRGTQTTSKHARTARSDGSSQRCTVGGVVGAPPASAASSSLGRFLGVLGATCRVARAGLATFAAAAADGALLAVVGDGGACTRPRPSWSMSYAKTVVFSHQVGLSVPAVGGCTKAVHGAPVMVQRRP